MTKRVAPDKRKLRGNPSGKKINAPLVGTGDVFDPPKEFNATQKAEWRYAVEFAPAGTLTASDRGLLKLWCIHSVINAQATKELFAKGEKFIVDSTGGTRPNPLLVVINKSSVMMLSIAKELGFTPASRNSLGAIGVGDPRTIEGSLVAFKDQRPTFDA